MTEPLLRVRDLVVEIPLARGVLRAVDGASFDVLPSEALGIVGESGSGKTMALRALLGLLPRKARITGGSIEFEGEDLVQAGEDRRRELRGTSLAMIFQEPMTALNPVMRVGEQIAEMPQVRLGESRSAARERAVDRVYNKCDAKCDEHRRPVGARGGNQREQRKRRATSGQNVD